MSDKAIDAQLIPVLLANSGVPSVATGEDAAVILEKVRSYSATLGTTVTIRGGYGYVHISRRS